MINCNIVRGYETVKIECIGHAGYAPAGYDIVCAAVSSLVQFLEIAILNADLRSNVYHDKNGAHITFHLGEMNQQDATTTNVLVEAFTQSMLGIENTYGAYLTTQVQEM